MVRAQADNRSSGRRILVTGGTGHIGSALCRRLTSEGDTVTVLARPNGDRWRLTGLSGNLSVAETKLTDLRQVAELVGQVEPEVVFHLACSVFNPPDLTSADHLDVNVRGTLCLLEALKDRQDCKLIHAGSAAEYPPGNDLTEDTKPSPVNAYGAMKACASLLIDTYVRMYGLRATRAMLFTVYGPGEATHRLVPSTILSASHGRNVCLKDGSVQRDMLFVEDAVEGLCRMAAADLVPGTVINLCSGTSLPVRHIAGKILHLMKASVVVEERPNEMRSDEITIMSGDNRRAREFLGWQPQWTLEAGLSESIAWYRTREASRERRDGIV